MGARFYTVQIFPEGSSQVRSYRLSMGYVKVLAWLAALILVFTAVLLWKLVEINAMLVTSKYLKNTNEKLAARHAEYEAAFAELDSIYAMESQIQNILQTFVENDSNRVQSILDRNRFKHIPSEKTKIDMDRIYEDVQDERSRVDHLPNILPVVGVISKRFHPDADHRGTDFAAPLHEPVYATAYGTVTFSGENGDLGLTIMVDHGNGYATRYGHLGQLYAKKGTYVKKGETIASVGLTGNTSGPHLHYEIIHDGKHVNPEEFFHE